MKTRNYSSYIPLNFFFCSFTLINEVSILSRWIFMNSNAIEFSSDLPCHQKLIKLETSTISHSNNLVNWILAKLLLMGQSLILVTYICKIFNLKNIINCHDSSFDMFFLVVIFHWQSSKILILKWIMNSWSCFLIFTWKRNF